ncbi:MAG: response regulator [Pseudomonadota bacterium]
MMIKIKHSFAAIKTSWNNSGITAKFSLVFGFVLLLLTTLSALNYTLLATVNKQTEREIVRSSDIQKLVMEMDTRLERARRLKKDFFINYMSTGVYDPDNRYSAMIHEQMEAISGLSRDLSSLILQSHVNERLQESNINLNLYFSLARRCSTTFNELLDLVKQQAVEPTGLAHRLDETMNELRSGFQSSGDLKIIQLFSQVELAVKNYMLTRERPFMQTALNIALSLDKAVLISHGVSDSLRLQAEGKLRTFIEIAGKVPDIDVAIQSKSNAFDLNTQTLEPVSSNMIDLARQGVSTARARNDRTVKTVAVIFLFTTLAGFLLVSLLAWVIHRSVTRPVVDLTLVAHRFQAGDLGARSRMDSRDELGQLSSGFNQMAVRLQQLIRDLEHQVEERTRELVDANRSLTREIQERMKAQTLKEALETELRQAHKMEAIGTLTGGIAHDFNNILGIILGNAELALDDVRDRTPVRKNLEEIQTACHRARDVVRQLLSFSRKSPQEQTWITLIPLVKESLNLLRSSIPSSVEILPMIPDQINRVLANPTQIHQVIINLCTNAAQAMDDGGLMTVGLEDIHLREKDMEAYRDLEPGQYIKLWVSDTGYGIPRDIIDKIFDPYFTTKEVGKGTGLGLSVVHGIVRSHRGGVSVKSRPGLGTLIEVLLPAQSPDQGQELDQPPPSACAVGTERILFVDDEPSLAAMGKSILQRLGYTVKTATDPATALIMIRSDPDSLDLVITDMTMPRMSGKDLAEQIWQSFPGLPVILCTGYSEKINEQTALDAGFRKYIEKPLNRQALAKAVREALDQGTGGPV